MMRDSRGPVSGEQMSTSLSISRVAVWKHIKSLQELGYSIEGTPSGYILYDTGDHLYSWEFDSPRKNYHTYRELNSTMDMARRKAEENCDNFTTVIAETQNEGRGRGNRKWESDEGGLYFTTVLRPQLPSAYHYIYTLAATTVICETVRELCSVDLQTKWPNDVLAGNNRKISGVLTEIHMTGDSISWLNLGVGINVNNNPGLEKSSSLKDLCGRPVSRRDILTLFENKYRKLLDSINPADVRSRWAGNSCTINKKIELHTGSGRILKGTAEGIDESGSLLIRDNSNKVKQALFGDLYIQ